MNASESNELRFLNKNKAAKRVLLWHDTRHKPEGYNKWEAAPLSYIKLWTLTRVISVATILNTTTTMRFFSILTVLAVMVAVAYGSPAPGIIYGGRSIGFGGIGHGIGLGGIGGGFGGFRGGLGGFGHGVGGFGGGLGGFGGGLGGFGGGFGGYGRRYGGYGYGR
nr:ctenidin-3-like [Cherax quadricarinatus]